MFINFGAPLNIKGTKFTSNEDRPEEQRKYITDFLSDIDALMLSETNVKGGF